MIEKILKAYNNHCTQAGVIFNEPSEITIKRKYAYLYNSYGIVAKYDLKEKKFI